MDDFYDDLAADYHLLYEDWESSLRHQGGVLHGLLTELGVPAGRPIQDAACGIGTQALGLLLQGRQLQASDLSAGAVQRMKTELHARGLQAEVWVDDLRSLSRTADASLAAVLACDNSLPHLLTDAEILLALRSAWRCLSPGGLALYSVRDYANIPRINADVRPYGLRQKDGNRFLAVQTWDWEGDQYELRLYLTEESVNGQCRTRVLRSRYYAITLSHLAELMQAAGFVDIEQRTGLLFQPLIWGRKPMQ